MKEKNMGYERLLYAVGDAIKAACDVNYTIESSSLPPTGSYLWLKFLPHPIIEANGRVLLKIAIEIAGDKVLNDEDLGKKISLSIRLAEYFTDGQSITILPNFWAMLYHHPDEKETSNGANNEQYHQHTSCWSTVLEFDLDKAINNFGY